MRITRFEIEAQLENSRGDVGRAMRLSVILLTPTSRQSILASSLYKEGQGAHSQVTEFSIKTAWKQRPRGRFFFVVCNRLTMLFFYI